MNSYRAYPIRCKTCNNQIACYAMDYENLIRNVFAKDSDINKTHAIEKSLNQLGLMSSCCRISMMNPTIETFNMENRELIEGIRHVDTIGSNKIVPRIPITPVLATSEAKSSSINTSRILSSGMSISRKGRQIGGMVKPTSTIVVKSASPITKVEDLVLDSSTPENLIDLSTPKNFEYPTQVGIPCINDTPEIYEPSVNAGNNYKVSILNGRTYLCR